MLVPGVVLFARLSTWGVRFAEEVGRGQVASIRLGATGQRVEFGVQRSPAQTESAGVSVCSVQKSASLKRWVYNVRGGRPVVTLRRIAAMLLGTLPRDDGWITESINWGQIFWQGEHRYESRS